MPIKFLRHCEAFHNINNNYYEHNDTSLTPNGVDQAEKLTGHYDLILCSPMRRCKETLLYSNITHNKVYICNLFREYKTHNCDLMHSEEKEFESEFEILNRISLIDTYISDLPRDKNILIITHADLLWYLSSHVREDERFGTWIKNGETILLKDLFINVWNK